MPLEHRLENFFRECFMEKWKNATLLTDFFNDLNDALGCRLTPCSS